MPKAMYIHIPFCDQICSYCDFCKLFTHQAFVDDYIKSLLKEVKTHYKNEVLETLYFGGGTPSALTKEQLTTLFEGLKNLQLSSSCEITFEANPENLTEEKIILLKAFGVNRVSIGAQTFNEKHLLFLNRAHHPDDVKSTISLLKKHGIHNINLDLMFGFPKQTLEEVKEDLSLYLEMNIPHISMYSLIIEEHTVISWKGISSINEELEADMYDLVIDSLTTNGYTHYEISNFSKNSYQSAHNLTYWNNEEYYGFGLGAHGYVLGKRYENIRNIKDYNNGKWMRMMTELTKLEKMQEQFFLGLRKMEGVSVSEFIERFGENPYVVFNMDGAILTGLIEEVDGYIRLTDKGKPLANEVFEMFV